MLGGKHLSRPAGFWLLATLMVALMFAAAAPSPIYSLYEARWQFSPVTLTAVFAVYALVLLVSLLFTGRLSDHLGRRPVLAAALVVQIGAMVAFILADGVAMLFVARAVQGFATGLATSTISAWLLDLQPPERPTLGGAVAAIAPQVGLAIGALASGILVEYAPEPLRLVFWLLVPAYALALLSLPAIEDVEERRPGALASLRPRIAVPPAARRPFATAAPALVATWALGGLYLSLGPSLAIDLLGTDSHLAGGLVIVALTGAGAVVSALGLSVAPDLLVARGSLALMVGTAITLLAVATGSVAVLYLGSLVAGAGFGPTFTGVFRKLAPLAPPENRGALVAAIYVVSYLAFSIPAVIAGVAVDHYGLPDATYGYGAVVIALAAFTALALWRGTNRPRPPDRTHEHVIMDI
jgi:MFS family permease